jgi:hypothetical protein
MDQRSYFQLAMRIVGLVVCLYGLDYLREFVAIQMGYWSLERTSPVLYFGSAAAFLIVGLYLIRGAPHFIRYAFPEDDVRDTGNNGESRSNGA